MRRKRLLSVLLLALTESFGCWVYKSVKKITCIMCWSVKLTQPKRQQLLVSKQPHIWEASYGRTTLYYVISCRIKISYQFRSPHMPIPKCVCMYPSFCITHHSHYLFIYIYFFLGGGGVLGIINWSPSWSLNILRIRNRNRLFDRFTMTEWMTRHWLHRHCSANAGYWHRVMIKPIMANE